MLDLLEDLSIAAALVDHDGRVLDMTPQAAEVDGFAVWAVGKRPQVDGLSADERFWQGLSELLEDNPGTAGSRLFVINSTRNKPVAIKAVRIRTTPLMYARTARLVLVLIDLQIKPILAQGVLRGLFKLTPAESRLARALLQHGGLEEAAQVIGISIGTARQELKSIFSKTGASRQSELLSLLSRIAVLGEIKSVHPLT